MKKYIFSSILIALLCNFSIAQVPYRVVFDMSSNDTLDHKMVIHMIDEITKSNPEAKMEVVFYGHSLDMIVKGKSTQTNAVQEFAKNKNVAFRVCEIALKNNHLEKSQLIAGVETVPDGIYELISKQAGGWGYIKVMH